MYGSIYSGLCTTLEGFSGSTMPSPAVSFVAILLILALVIVQLFIVQFLWNNVLVKVTTVIKPLPSLIYTLGLLVLVALIYPGAV
jgi:hypothetical protein